MEQPFAAPARRLVSRRSFLQRTAQSSAWLVMAGSGLLAACAPQAPAAPQGAAAPAGGAKSAPSELQVYILPSFRKSIEAYLIPAMKEQHNVEVLREELRAIDGARTAGDA